MTKRESRQPSPREKETLDRVIDDVEAEARATARGARERLAKDKPSAPPKRPPDQGRSAR